MLPCPITLDIVPNPIGAGYLYLAHFEGHDDHGPVGCGKAPGDAINMLVDNFETMIARGEA